MNHKFIYLVTGFDSKFLKRFILIIFCFWVKYSGAQTAKELLDIGWHELIMDHDTTAIQFFEQANLKATQEKNDEIKAKSFLYAGFASYGTSYSNGLQYCLKAMEIYKKMQISSPAIALQGRSRCLQLMSTINSRQGKYKEAIELSREALAGFTGKQDTTGTVGLIYMSLGNAYDHFENRDSASYYYRLGLDEYIRSNNTNYIPNAYCKVAHLEHLNGRTNEALTLYHRALAIADSTNNQQAKVRSLLGFAQFNRIENNEGEALQCLLSAKKMAQEISDKLFYLQVLEELSSLLKSQGKFQEALKYQEEVNSLNESLNSWEKQRILKSLEVQFNVLEKDRKIKLIQRENELSRMTNILLLTVICFILIIGGSVYFFMRRISKRDKELLKSKEELAMANEEQKRLTELQLQNEIEFKESQLTALTLQMLQKNELMQELKEKYDQESVQNKDHQVGRIISKAMNQDKDWADFNLHFESMNKNFYQRLKKEYPDISPNDMKICALIKLNLSIKEMAGILNISPDSVKTARYRLRKKLDLNTEDNLTTFILNL